MTSPERRRRPDIADALRGHKGPGALVGFLAAGAFLLGALLLFALGWGLAALGVPMVLVAVVGVGALFGAFALLQRSVRE